MPMKRATRKKATKKRAALAKPWSSTEVGYLKKFFKAKTARQIGTSLGRTINAVRAKAASLKLKKGVARKAAGKKAIRRRLR